MEVKALRIFFAARLRSSLPKSGCVVACLSPAA